MALVCEVGRRSDRCLRELRLHRSDLIGRTDTHTHTQKSIRMHTHTFRRLSSTAAAVATVIGALAIAALLCATPAAQARSLSDYAPTAEGLGQAVTSSGAWIALKAMMEKAARGASRSGGSGGGAGRRRGDRQLVAPTDEVGEALYAERGPIQRAIDERRYDDAIKLAERLLGKLDATARTLPKRTAPLAVFGSGKQLRESIETLLTYIEYDKAAALKRAGRLVEAYVELKRLRATRRKVPGIAMGEIDALENCVWVELAAANKYKKPGDLLGLRDETDLKHINETYRHLSELLDETKIKDLDVDLQISLRELRKWLDEAYADAVSSE